MNHLEIEFKTLLTKEEYLALEPFFEGQAVIYQTNHYIDTPTHAIHDLKMALRIRILPEKAELTLKVPQDAGHFEYNQSLSQAQVNQFLTQDQLPKAKFMTTLSNITFP